jgi:hypothetical protein
MEWSKIFFTQRLIKKIMNISDISERETKLRTLAKDLSCSLSSTYADGKHMEEELIRRIHEAARSHRESYLWFIAFISAIASVFSAIAAWFAVRGGLK